MLAPVPKAGTLALKYEEHVGQLAHDSYLQLIKLQSAHAVEQIILQSTPGLLITQYPVQQNALSFFQFYSTLQYLCNQCYVFRSLIGSSPGIYIKVAFHKSQVEMHIHVRRVSF